MSNYYCSQKFWWLTVDPSRRLLNSCCASSAHKIDIHWLQQNSGNLFNSVDLIKERQEMLQNVPVSSCDAVCWGPEKQGLTSRRLSMQSNQVTHTNIKSDPEHLNIILGKDCNLTCVYCNKQYSTTWLRDIMQNGSYLEENRFQLNNNDKISLKLGQKNLIKDSTYQFILDQLGEFTNLKSIEISGGEPLLYNNLPDILEKIKAPDVRIITGLGVTKTRLQKIIDKINTNVKFLISVENCNEAYEFVRYGNTYDDFLTNFKIITNKFDYNLMSVISNITIHGFLEFERNFDSNKIIVNFCTDPDYLSVNVLDNTSKENLKLTKFSNSNLKIQKSLDADYTVEQKRKLQIFLKKFVELRKNISLNIFPKSYIDWLNTP